MEEPRRPRRFWNILLFLATLVTTFMAGAEGHPEIDPIMGGLVYMVAVMAILVSHEMGHFVFARRNRVDATLPYFIPMPGGPIGTMGAVIALRGRIRSRDALMEVGAAGPIAGVLVTIPVLLIGLSLSPVKPLTAPAVLEGQSLLYMLLKWIAVGPIPAGHDVHLHPVAWAGWIGLFLTVLNLLPVGQLDGGHVVYALIGAGHRRVSRIFTVAIFTFGLMVLGHGAWLAHVQGLEGELYLMAVSARSTWFLWGILLTLFFGRGRRAVHPPTDDDRLSPSHRVVGYLCVLLFVATFIPVPLQFLL